jgi:hypothetical protein
MWMRPHRALVGLLLVGATWATLLAVGARWVDHQLLDARRWTATSGQLIANPVVSRAIASFLADRAFGAAGIDAAISGLLPGSAATSAEAKLHGAATDVGTSLLATRPGRATWRSANHQAASGLLRAAKHSGGNRAVVLDLSPLLRDTVRSLAGSTVAQAIPGSSQLLTAQTAGGGRIVVLHAAELGAVSTGVRTSRTLGWALPLIALGLFALALILAHGWRTVVLSRIGYSLMIAGGALLAFRALAQYPLSDVFVSSSLDRAAMRATWLIATSQLRTSAVEVLITGTVIAVGSWVMRVLVR